MVSTWRTPYCCAAPLLLVSLLTPSVGKAQVSGQVSNLVSGAVIRDASVELREPNAPPVSENRPDAPPPVILTQTDSQGRFSFSHVAPGTYRVGVIKAGFVSTSTRNMPTVTVAAGQAPQELLVKLTPYSTVAGKVTGDDGQPMEGVRVYGYRKSYFRGELQYRTFTAPTDDLGEYRIPNLPARTSRRQRPLMWPLASPSRTSTSRCARCRSAASVERS
jgi:hypothetical protein